MNRAERRKMMKKVPGYKKALKSGSKKAVDDLEKMFQKQWDMNRENLERSKSRSAEALGSYIYNDETLNNGDIAEFDNSEDEIYND